MARATTGRWRTRGTVRRKGAGSRATGRGRPLQGLVSVAGLSGAPVVGTDGAEVGRVVDVVAQWGGGLYPAVTGLVVRVGPRRVLVRAEQLAELSAGGARLSSAQVDVRDFVRRPGEVLLARDVIDHQLVDVDGARVVRASDLYLARAGGQHLLVAVDVGVKAFLRRLGPGRMRRRAVPERVLDWADVAPFSAPGAPVRLRLPHERLRELHPAELADLLEDLGRAERHELLTVLSPETAADVLEEMEADEVTSLLRDAAPVEAAELLARMEPDEAVDALRALAEGDRERILAAMPERDAAHLSGLLAYPEREAGGFMTTHLVLVRAEDTVGTIRGLLRARHEHGADIDAVAVVDEDGRLVDDVSLFDLLVAEPAAPVGDLVAPPWPATVTARADLDEVAEALATNRRSSLLVVDDEGRPIGRILADDVLDVLTAAHARRWPWQQG